MNSLMTMSILILEPNYDKKIHGLFNLKWMLFSNNHNLMETRPSILQRTLCCEDIVNFNDQSHSVDHLLLEIDNKRLTIHRCIWTQYSPNGYASVCSLFKLQWNYSTNIRWNSPKKISIMNDFQALEIVSLICWLKVQL